VNDRRGIERRTREPHEVTDEKRAVKLETDGEIPERRIQVYIDTREDNKRGTIYTAVHKDVYNEDIPMWVDMRYTE
jgi:hypothetical protein